MHPVSPTYQVTMENTDLNQAIEMYRRHPRHGFASLYRVLSGRIATFVKRAFGLGADEVADVVHDCFLPWVEEPERMAKVENPRAYLFSTAKYLAIQRRRAEARIAPGDSGSESEETANAGEGHARQTETSLDVAAALDRLPDDQREVVALKIWGDLTFEEIAAVQEVSLNTAASRYRYALQKLKEILA